MPDVEPRALSASPDEWSLANWVSLTGKSVLRFGLEVRTEGLRRHPLTSRLRHGFGTGLRRACQFPAWVFRWDFRNPAWVGQDASGPAARGLPEPRFLWQAMRSGAVPCCVPDLLMPPFGMLPSYAWNG